MDGADLASDTRSKGVEDSQDTNMSVLEGLTSTWAQLAKASETQTAMLASLKEDLLLRTDSDEDGEAAQSLNDSVDLNAALTDVLDPSDTHTSTTAAAKPASCPDSGSQDDILESLTQAFVQTKEKSPAIAEKIAGLIDNMVTGGLSPNTIKERVEKYPPPENCKFLSTTTVNEEIWDLLPRRSRTVDLAFQRVQEPLVQGLSALSILGDQLVKDLHAGKTLNTRQILDHVMDSIALLANANFKLNMARRELIKPELNPPYTRLCKDEIKPSTKLFGDDLSKHLEDMAEAKKVGRQMQKTSETRTASQGYFKAGRQKFRRPNFKPYDRPSSQKTSQQRPFLGYSRAQKSAQKKPSQPTNKTQ